VKNELETMKLKEETMALLRRHFGTCLKR